MHIVLDTNVLVADLSLTSEKIRLLIEYAQRTESQLVVSEVTLLELEGHVRRRLEENASKLVAAADAIQVLTGNRPSITEGPDAEEEARRYLERVKKRYGIVEGRILRSKPEHLASLVQRSVRRVKPFSDRGEEFRDALIWLQILEIGAGAKSPVDVSFISANTRDFAQEGSLHVALRSEADAANLKLQYFPSLDGFLKAHADKIAYITSEFLEGLLDVRDIEEAAVNDSGLVQNIERWFRRRHDAPGYVKLIQVVDLSLDDFYVYPNVDGEWTVFGIYVGAAEVEGDVWDYHVDPDGYDRPEARTVLKYTAITVQLEFSISGVELKRWEITETAVDG